MGGSTHFIELFVVRFICICVSIINYYEIPLKKCSFGTYLYKEQEWIYIHIYMYILREGLSCIKK